MSSENRYDLIAIGAHPDDVEVGTGGVLLKMAQMGYRTGIIYLTKGEMGTGGTPEIRARESLTAAQIMKTDLLETLDLGDTKLVDTPENRNIVAELIRKYQPTLLLAPWPRGGHGKRGFARRPSCRRQYRSERLLLRHVSRSFRLRGSHFMYRRCFTTSCRWKNHQLSSSTLPSNLTVGSRH